MKNVQYIVLHTAAHYSPSRKKCFDTTKANLRQWHVKERGWTDIGYHFLVRWDGTVEECRPVARRGAHVRGLNHKSLGVCFSGCGEHEPLKPAQRAAGIALVRRLMTQHDVSADDVIGHNEILQLVDEGKLHRKYRTSKACPGRYVDMDAIREELRVPEGVSIVAASGTTAAARHCANLCKLCGACVR